MLMSRESAGRNLVLAAAAVAIAFAAAFALPYAAWAYPDEEAPGTEQDGGGTNGDNGSFEDTPSGGADDQGDQDADLQQGVGAAAPGGLEGEPGNGGGSGNGDGDSNGGGTGGDADGNGVDGKGNGDTPDDGEGDGTTSNVVSEKGEGAEGDGTTEKEEGEATEEEKDEPAEEQTVTVAFSDGEATSTVTAKAGEMVIMPLPTRDGYTLLGWATSDDPTAVKFEAGASYAFTKDMTLVAVWVEDADGQTEDADQQDREQLDTPATEEAETTEGLDDDLKAKMASAKPAQVQYMMSSPARIDVRETAITVAASKQNIEAVFAGAAAKGNLVKDLEGTVNYGTWWAYYTSETDVTFNGQTQHVLPKTLMVGAFDDAESKEVCTLYYLKNHIEPDYHRDTRTGYSAMPWYTTTVDSKLIKESVEYIRTFGGVQPLTYLVGWFQECQYAGEVNSFRNVRNLELSGLDTSKCVSFRWAFYDYYGSPTFTGMGEWDTSHVVDFSGMFSQCFLQASSGSIELDLHNWDMIGATLRRDSKSGWDTNITPMFCTEGYAGLDLLVLGNRCVLEGSDMRVMGKGMWYVEKMEDPSLADQLVYEGFLIDADGLESLYRSEGNNYGVVYWRRLGSATYYGISYEGNGGLGSVAKSYAIAGGSVALAPNGVTLKSQLFKREGYRIASWNTQSDGNGAKYELGAKINPKGDMTLYAIWELADGFRIQYDVDGGTPGYSDKVSADSGLINWNTTKLIPEENPTKPGYTFAGWYVVNSDGKWVDRNGNVQDSARQQATTDSAYNALTNNDDPTIPLILKALWEEKSITLTYAAENGNAATVVVTDTSNSSETKKPSVGFSGATATLSPGYHALYWKNSLYPRTYLYGTSTVDAQTGVETNVLSVDEIKSVAYFGGEWHDATFTLVVEGNAFTLHFDPNGATANHTIADMNMRYGDVAYLPNATGSYVKAGYLFNGWANAKSEAMANALNIQYRHYPTNEPFNESNILDGSTFTLYAVWQERTSTVTFRADYPEGAVVLYDDDGVTELLHFEGSGTSGDWVQTIGRSTGTLLVPTAVAKDGYRFLYWIDDSTKQVVSTDATWAPVQVGGAWPEASVYRAKFEPKTYLVAFDANGGVGSMVDQGVTYGQIVTLKPNSVSQLTLLREINKPGYVFAGWTTAADGSGSHYDDQGQLAVDGGFLNLLGDDGLTVTLYAKWAARPVTLRYNAGAADVSNSATYVQQVKHETPATLMANQFRRYGYAFAGWSRTFGGALAYENRAEDVVFDVLADGAEIDLYALWEPVTWKVSFAATNEEDGSISPATPVEVVHGAAFGSAGAEPKTVPETGKVFLNWAYEMQVDAAGTMKRGTVLAGDMASFEVLGQVTFTAMWGPSSIKVLYDPGLHGAFAANSLNYTYFPDIAYNSPFNPHYGQGGYSYNGGVDDETTNTLNVGNPMGEAGWVFAYWSWYDEGGTYRTSLSSQFPSTLTTSYTFVAHWKPGGYTLSFDPNGGSPTSDTSLEPVPMVTGQLFTLPTDADVERTGYYFRGWGASANGPVEYLGGQRYAMTAGDAVLYAQWDPYRFVLHFDSQGGSPVDDSVGLTWDSQFLLKDQADARYLTETTKADDLEPSKPGYTFAGWYASLDDMDFPHLAVTNDSVLGLVFAGFVGEGGPVDGQGFTLYAKWTPNMATIHYAPVDKGAVNKESALSDKNRQVQPGTSETLEAAMGAATAHTAVAAPGYAFLYWADADGNVLSYDASFTPTKGAYDPANGDFDIWVDGTYFFAVFDIVRYVISFDANGGDGAIGPMNMTYNTAAGLTSNANGLIYRSGYAFLGWNTAADGTGANYADGATVNNLTTTMDDTVVLYARWQKADQKLVFYVNYAGYAGADGEKTFEVIGGQQVRLPNDTLWTRDHYNLVQWNTKADGSGTAYTPGAGFTVPGIKADTDGERKLDLYAIWQGIGYKVHFVANAADATGTMADQSLEYGYQERLTPGAFARQGYTFIGWATDAASGTVVHADGAQVLNLTDVEGAVVQLYAVWSPNANKVSFVNGDATYGKVVAYDQNVLTGGKAVYDNTTVVVSPAKGHVLAGWAYEVFADGADKVLDSGMVLDPASLTITGRTVFTAHWSYPYAVQYLPGVWGGFEPWTSEPQWVGAVIPEPPASIFDANTGLPASKSVSYTFAGWKDQNGNTYGSYEAIRNALAMTEEGWIFEAQWNAIQALLSFDANGGTWAGGSAPAAIADKLHGEIITLPDGTVLATRPGYTFDGWSRTAAGDMEYAPGADFTMDVDVKKLYAHWVPKLYSVRYDMGNGPAIAHSIGVTWDDYVAGIAAGWLDGSFYADHVFLGWATDAAPTTVASGLAAADVGETGMKLGALFAALGIGNDDPQDVALHAVWDLREVTITYYSREYHGDVKVVGYDTGSNYKVDETFKADGTPKGATVTPREGYRFIGWYDGSGYDEDGNAVAATLLSTDATWTPGKAGLTYWSDASYWAWYAPFTYTVCFLANDSGAAEASAGMPPQPMTYDKWEKLAERNLQIVKPGYTFKYWTLGAADTGRTFSDGQMVINLSALDGGTVTLYAQWAYGDYTVVFDKNAKDDGGTTDSQSFQYGEEKPLNENGFWRNGYKLLGWATSPYATVQEYLDKANFKLAAGEPEATVTLYAVWAIADNYTLEFAVDAADADKGEITDDVTTTPALTRTVTFSQTLNKDDFTVTSKDGYAFAGWKITYYTHSNRGDIALDGGTITSHDPYGSINGYVIKGFRTVATAIWEKMYRVSYDPGDHGDFTDDNYTAWTSGYQYNGAAVPTFGSGVTAATLAGWLAEIDTGIVTDSTTTPATTRKVYIPKSRDAAYVFEGWLDTGAGGKLYKTWDDLEGLTFNGADVTLVAQWIPVANVKIVYNWGTVVPSTDAGPIENTVVVPAHTATKLYDSVKVTSLNYVLAGWATAADSKAVGYTVYSPGQQILMPAETVNLYAVWSEKTVTIRYKVRTASADMGKLDGWGLSREADGTLFQEVGIETGRVYGIDGNGERYVISETPLAVYANANLRYVFNAWMSDDTDAATVKYGSSPFTVQKGDTGYEEATYWALFRESDAVRIGYNIEVDGKDTLSEDVKTADVGWVTLVEEYVDPATGDANGATAFAYNGWEFVGWYTSGGALVTKDATLTLERPQSGWPHDGLTYVARFKASEKMSYTVEHWLEDENGAYALPADPAYTETFEAAYGARVTGTAKTGLDGYWYNAQASATTASATLSGNAATTLVLYYSRDRFTVTYRYANEKPTGAPVVPDAVEYRWGQTVALADAPSATGFTFDGWTLADGSASITVAADGTFEVPRGNVVLVGTWVPDIVTLSFNPNGGAFATDESGQPVQAVRPKSFVAGTSFNLPGVDDVSYAGRVLVGWSTDPNGPIEFTPSQSIYMPYDLPDVKRTLYAIWQEKLVRVQFDQAVRTSDGQGGYTYTRTTGTLANVGSGNLIVDGSRLSMLVGSVSGKVFGYYNSTVVEATAPYEAYASAPAGHTLVMWMDDDGASHGNAATFSLTRGADGLYAEQVYTAVYDEAGAVRVTFTMITEDGNVVNSADIAFSPNITYQDLLPASGVAQAVAVVDNQAPDAQTGKKAYSFVGWFVEQANGTRVLVDTNASFTPQRNAQGLYEAADYYAVFHDENSGMASFTVEHYLQKADGSEYESTPAYTQKVWGSASSTATATAMSIPGYTLAAGQAMTGGTLPASGDSGIVIKLNYDRNAHKVTYSYAGTVPTGAPVLPASYDARYGTSQAVASVGKVRGYTFSGWSSANATLASDGNGGFTFDMPDADVVLAGYFQPIVYDVVFASDAGKATVSGAGAAQQAAYGTPVSMTDPASGAPWVVVTLAAGNAQVQYGWNYDVADEDGNAVVTGGFVVDPSTLTVAGDTTFTANWIDGFTITYLPGDHGDFTQGPGRTVFAGLTPAQAIATWAAYNSETDASGDPRGASGYKFVAWQWADPATGALLRSDAGVAMPAWADADYAFTALWEATTATLTFDVNGGAWAAGADPNGASGTGIVYGIGSVNALPGDPANPDALATRAGYRLAGWGTSATGPAVYALGDNYAMPGADTTLYLIWAELEGVTIYYEAGEGGAVSLPTEQVKAVSGGAAGSTATPKSGRVFKEWQLFDANGTLLATLSAPATLVPTAAMLPGGAFAEGMTFKALFEEDTTPVTISYQVAVLDVDGSPLVNAKGQVGGYVIDSSETLLPVSGNAKGTTAIAYANVPDPADPSKTASYRLLYWKDSAGNIVGVNSTTATVTSGSIMPQRNADGAYEAETYTAVFQKINEVVITFDKNADDADPVVPAGVREEANTTANPSTWTTATPTRPGYTFAGWSASATATTPDAGLSAGSTSWNVPNANTTLYAVWSANADATATLDAGDGVFADGSGASTHTTTYTAPAGTIVAVADMPAPTRPGYTFAGWSTTQGASAADKGLGLDGSWAVSATTLHAVWQANDDTAYTVQFDLYVDGVFHKTHSTVAKTGTTGANVDATGDVITIDGYQLAATQPDAGGTVGGDGKTVLKLRYDALPNALSVNLDNGAFGTGATSPAGTHVTDAVVKVPAATDVSKAGYRFVKWTLSWVDGANVKHADDYDPNIAGQDSFRMPAFDAVLKAVWEELPKFTLAYDVNGGTLAGTVATPVVKYAGDTVTLPTAADVTAPVGKHLEGWWTSALSGDAASAGIAPYVGTYTMGGADTVLYAVWADNDAVAVILIAGEGLFANGLNSEGFNAPAGSLVAVNDMPTPTRAGYDFKGWGTSQGATATDANLAVGDTWTVAAATLHAVWEARNDTAYVIEYYKVVGTGAPVKFDSTTGKGTSGAPVDALTHAYTTGTVQGSAAVAGYTQRADNLQADAAGAIAGDGSTVLKVYFDADGQAFAIPLGDGAALSGFAFEDQNGTEPNLTATYLTDSTVTLPNKSQVSRPGYELDGWTVTYGSGNDATTLNLGAGGTFATPAMSVTVTPVWKATTSGYTVNHIKRFDGGTSVELTLPMTAPTGTAVSLANGDFALIAIPGFTYDTGSVSSGTVAAGGGLVIDLYYDAVEYKVTYDVGAASGTAWAGHATPQDVVKAWAGKTVTIAGAGTDAPTRAGYSFLGWTRTAGATAADADIAPGASFTLAAADYLFYAVWKAFDVTLAFEGSDGSTKFLNETPVTGSKANIDTSVGATVPLGALGFARPGYTFDGWYLSTDAAATKTLYNGNFDVPVVDHDGATLTLVAQWTPIDYTIIYRATTPTSGGAYIEVARETVRWGEVDDAKLIKSYSRTGWIFNGWYSAQIFMPFFAFTNGKAYKDIMGASETVTTRDLYASMTQKQVTITYYAMSDETPVVKTFGWDQVGIDTGVIPSRLGYSFGGWFRNQVVLSLPFVIPGTNVDSKTTAGDLCNGDDSDGNLSKTIYAKMVKKSYTLKYETNGGLSISDRKNVDWDSVGLDSITPVWDGHVFEGWYADAAFTTPVTSKTRYFNLHTEGGDDETVPATIYAKWSASLTASGMQVNSNRSELTYGESALQPAASALQLSAQPGVSTKPELMVLQQPTDVVANQKFASVEKDLPGFAESQELPVSIVQQLSASGELGSCLDQASVHPSLVNDPPSRSVALSSESSSSATGLDDADALIAGALSPSEDYGSISTEVDSQGSGHVEENLVSLVINEVRSMAGALVPGERECPPVACETSSSLVAVWKDESGQ